MTPRTAVRRTLAGAVSLGVLAGLPLVTAAPAAALSCVGPTTVLRGADQAFTGRIVEVDLDAGRVVVEVAEVWWGGPVARRVSLGLGLPAWWPADVASGEPDADRLWVLAPHEEGGERSVNPCTAWSLRTPGVAGFAPAAATQPVADGPTESSPGPGWWSGWVDRLLAALGR